VVDIDESPKLALSGKKKVLGDKMNSIEAVRASHRKKSAENI